jgi:hypothetical protein
MDKQQWELFYKLFRKQHNLQLQGLRRKDIYKILEKEYGNNKYFVKIENQPKI